MKIRLKHSAFFDSVTGSFWTRSFTFSPIQTLGLKTGTILTHDLEVLEVTSCKGSCNSTKHLNLRYWNIARWPFSPVKLTFLKIMANQSLFAKTSCTFVISPCIDPEGKVIDEIWNEETKHPHVKYYYSGPQECMLTKLKWFPLSYCLEWKKCFSNELLSLSKGLQFLYTCFCLSCLSLRLQ